MFGCKLNSVHFENKHYAQSHVVGFHDGAAHLFAFALRYGPLTQTLVMHRCCLSCVACVLWKCVVKLSLLWLHFLQSQYSRWRSTVSERQGVVLSTHEPHGAVSFHCCLIVSLCELVGCRAGSNALYNAKLNWIKLCLWGVAISAWVDTVLMKGIFSTFGSVKSSLLNCTGKQNGVTLFILFSRSWLDFSLKLAQLLECWNRERERRVRER